MDQGVTIVVEMLIARTVIRSFICDVIHKKNAHCSMVAHSCYSSEPFLASSVPLYDTGQLGKALMFVLGWQYAQFEA